MVGGERVTKSLPDLSSCYVGKQSRSLDSRISLPFFPFLDSTLLSMLERREDPQRVISGGDVYLADQLLDFCKPCPRGQSPIVNPLGNLERELLSIYPLA